MDHLSAPTPPRPAGGSIARARRGRLARGLAVLACSALVASTGLFIAIDHRADRAAAIQSSAARTLADARRLAARVRAGDGSEAAFTAAVLPYVHGLSTPTRVDLVTATGAITWSTGADRAGKRETEPALGWTSPDALAWLRPALAVGGAAHASGDGRLVGAIVPLHLAAGGPSALIVVGDHSDEAAEDSDRLWLHLAVGLLVSVGVGLGLWQLLVALVSRPLSAMARAVETGEFDPADLVPFERRNDEIGVLARGFGAWRQAREDQYARDLERAARLESALEAGTDGLAMASLVDGEWIVDRVNQTLAEMLGRPVSWFEGRTVEDAMAGVLDRLSDPGGVARWVRQGLGDLAFESAFSTALAHPDAEIEMRTRPMRDAQGRPFGRIWILRDVTAARARERQLVSQNQELAVLDLVGRRVSRSLAARAILTDACATLGDVLEANAAVLFAGGDDTPLRPLSLPRGARGEAWPASALAGLAAAIEGARSTLRPEEPLRLTSGDLAGDPAAILPAGCDALVCLPLSDSSALVAALVLARPAGREWSEEEMALLRRLRYPIEAALENARLFARTEAQLVENQTLSEVSRSIGRADVLDAVLSEILSVVCTRLAYRNAAILLPDERTGDLYVRASEGYHGTLSDIRLPVNGTSVTAACFRAGEVVNVPDVRRYPGYVAGSDDIRSELALPLRIGDRVLGILDLESDRPDAFRPEDERLLTSVASQAAIVLANASLFAEARARATRFEAVNEIARAVSSTLDASRLDRVIVQQLARVVPSDRYAVLRYRHDTRRVERAVVLDARTNLARGGDGVSWGFDEGFDPTLLTPHKAEHVPDLTLASPRAEARHVAQGMASLVLVPVALDGEVEAAIVAASTRRGGFSDEQIRLLETVSYHVGVALKNAELFSRLQSSYTQLNEAQDGLVRSEKLRALGEMASGVAHDFNNVLGAILARTQLLRAAATDPALAEELGIVERAALDGAATVRRLQDFTRVRTDRTSQPVNLAQVVEDCLSLTRGRWRDEAARAGQRFELVTQLLPVPPVAGQASELREALTNVILNALDAMPSGGSLTLSTRVDAEAGEVVIEVRDTGHGMTEEVRARIFDPFFTTKGVRGVGLGLSVVYGIVQRHGGRIEIESSPGAGTLMRIVLPAMAEEDVLLAGERTRAEDGERALLAELRPGGAGAPALRVLVIDDEPSVRSLLRDLLRAAGHEAVEAPNGRDGIERIARGETFDVVLTDLGMPDLSGWDVARAVAERPDPPPVILVTGWGIQLDDRTLSASRVAAVVAKPFTLEDVLGALERVTRKAA